MDIHHFANKRSTAQSSWVYSQKGYDFLARKQIAAGNLPNCQQGMPVPYAYRQVCPMWWTYNGWVEEELAQSAIDTTALPRTNVRQP